MMRDVHDLVVVGAGIVGSCCARYLQEAGHEVVLVDRIEPGMGCSFGNAGIISNVLSSTQPPGPRLLKQIPNPKHFEGDVGYYISSGVIVARDPESGERSGPRSTAKKRRISEPSTTSTTSPCASPRATGTAWTRSRS